MTFDRGSSDHGGDVADQPPRQNLRRSTVVAVAPLAGVSVGTVSNSLNRPDVVTPATRALVEDAIQLLDFVPNGQARALARGGTRTIGMLVADLANSFFVDMVRGAEEAASAAGYSLLVASSDTSASKQREILRIFDESRFDGVLVTPFEAAAPYREPHGLRAPSVLLNVERPTVLGASVVSDDEYGGYLAGKHLIEQGCTSVHFVGGPIRLAPIAQRLRGVERAVSESKGVRLTTEFSPFRDHLGEGAAVGRAILDMKPAQRPNGVVAVSDLVALAIIHSVRDALDVPRDLAVIGYDNNAAARDAVIPVSTIAQAGAKMGRSAFKLLANELRTGIREERMVVLKPHLVKRASSAA